MDAETLLKLRDTNSSLAHTYPLYRQMYDSQTLFAYKGLVTSDLVQYVLQIMQDRLDEDRNNKRTSKKVFNVMVECLKNVYVSTEELTEVHYDDYDPTAILLVKKEPSGYTVSTGNYVLNSKVHDLKEHITKVNELSPDDLRKYYQHILTTEALADRGITGLGLVDIAKKSRQKLVCRFDSINENYAFFTLEAKISRSGK